MFGVGLFDLVLSTGFHSMDVLWLWLRRLVCLGSDILWKVCVVGLRL